MTLHLSNVSSYFDLCSSSVWQTMGLHLGSKSREDNEELWRPAISILFLFLREIVSGRKHYGSAGLGLRWKTSKRTVKVVPGRWLQPSVKATLCSWPASELGIYAELSNGLFSTNAQVWKQFVIGRFMANKHIVWYTVINYINNFKIVYTSYFQHLVLLIICLPDSN